MNYFPSIQLLRRARNSGPSHFDGEPHCGTMLLRNYAPIIAPAPPPVLRLGVEDAAQLPSAHHSHYRKQQKNKFRFHL